MLSLRSLPLASQMFALCAALCVGVFAALILFVSYQTNAAARRGAADALQSQLRVVNEILSLAYQSELRHSEQMMQLFLNDLPGPLQVDGSAIQTGELRDVPQLKAGEVVLNGNNRYIDEFKRRTGLEAAIMVLHAGRFIRIATLLKDKAGKLMIGTPLPGNEPAIQAAGRGEKSLRVVVRNDRYYLIYYLPVKNPGGSVIGVVTVRSELDRSVEILKRILSGIRIGDTGHLYAVTGSQDALRFVVHPQHAGKAVSAVWDAGQQAMLGGMTKAGSGILEFQSTDGQGRRHPAMAAYLHHPDWNWTLVYGSYIDEFTADDRALRNGLIGFAVAAAALTTLAIFFALRQRMQPLGSLLRALDAFGRGDLAQRLPALAHSRNEVDRMAGQLNASMQQVGDLVRRISSSADQVSTAAGQLESSASQVEQSSRTQSGSAAAMAHDVDSIAAGIGQIAEHATTAAAMTNEARQAADHGQHAVQQTVAEMERISGLIHATSALIMSLGERSQQVSGIVKNIKDIADQTNLLALNAAIEAARAGEQGRGFAVVADEVRKLAERTSSSAVEIAQKLGAVQEETLSVVERMEDVSGDMQGGVAQARQAGEVLQTIQRQSQHTAQAVRDIAGATAEQRQAAQSLASAISGVAASSQQNAGVTADNRLAAQRLIALAHDLQGVVRQFRV